MSCDMTVYMVECIRSQLKLHRQPEVLVDYRKLPLYYSRSASYILHTVYVQTLQ
jgi:hypothetical protein